MVIRINGRLFFYPGLLLALTSAAFFPLLELIIPAMIIAFTGLLMIVFNQYLEIDTTKEEQ